MRWRNLLMIMSSLRSGSRCRDKAGGLQILDQVAGTERPDWADRVVVVLDLLDRQSGGRFGDLDADARLAVIERLLDDPDYVWFLSPPGGSDRAARAGG